MMPDEILNRITVASPCTADWDGMAGNDQVRFCSQCRKHVYNIAEIPAADVVRRIQESEGNLCVRLYRRRDGTVLNGDCPVGIRRVWSRWKRLVAVATAAGIVAVAARLTPSLQASVPGVQLAAPTTPSSPGPVMLALGDFVATLKEWLGITPEPNFGPAMGEMVEMGDICLPPGWSPKGGTEFLEDIAVPPPPPSAIRSSGR